jgi:hypothetical protein
MGGKGGRTGRTRILTIEKDFATYARGRARLYGDIARRDVRLWPRSYVKSFRECFYPWSLRIERALIE